MVKQWDHNVKMVLVPNPHYWGEKPILQRVTLQMVRDPLSLDVVVASNLFGDVLTDIAAVVQGGMGMAASASLAPGSETPGSRSVRSLRTAATWSWATPSAARRCPGT